ncbi:zf-C2H2 domain containing protein [Asbolus verrucosus]|uniref:Zf-C2H2 domain containing protein n=1 Tax=Asbolus verrucosus TaxID=1661398 RepID=A0A482VME6_ASBVE|nr:zf-C2H2 domain containing protein [Asbolus verrucosus]
MLTVNKTRNGQLDQYAGNMQDLRSASLPDVIQQQQSGLKQTKNGLGGELRLFKCLTCGKDFKQKSTLLQHERIHTDSRPYGAALTHDHDGVSSELQAKNVTGVMCKKSV